MTRARAMTSDEKTLSRLERQRTQLFISGLENRPVVFSARINQVFSTHDMVAQFGWDGLSQGAYANVLVGMTAYIGSVEGAYDVGICRVRKVPTSNLFYVGETSEVDFADNLWVTV